VNSRRDFLYKIILGSGAVFLAPLPGCEYWRSGEETKKSTGLTKASDPLVPRTNTPQFKIAHNYLRDGVALPQPSREHALDVIVIGGGISGLAAALVLKNHGVHAALLESEPRVGGAAVSSAMGKANVPLGSVYFVSRTEDVDMLLKAAKIEPVVCPDDAFILADGARVKDLWSDRGLAEAAPNSQDRQGMQRFRDALLAMTDDLPSYPLDKTLSARLQELDAQSAQSYVMAFKSSTLECIVNAYSRSSMGAPSDQTNAYCLLNFYQSELGSEYGYSRYSFPGGTARLAQGVARNLSDIHTSALVASLREDYQHVSADVVETDGSVTRYRALYAIVAAPKYQLSRLLSHVDDTRSKALRTLRYAPYATMQVRSSVKIATGDAYDTWDLRNTNTYTDVIDPMCIQPEIEDHIVSLYVPLDAKQRTMLTDSQAFASFVAATVETFAASLTDQQRQSIIDVHAWGWGHGIVVPTVGSHNGPAQQACVPTSRLRFAGTDSDCAPALENAAEQGARAARDIVGLLSGPTGR